MTTRSTALCSSERLPFSGNRLTPERSAYELRFGLQDPFGPSFEQAPRRPAREFKLKPQLGQRRRHAGASGANAQILKPLEQFRNSPTAGLSPREASHDRLPQVDAKGLDLNAFFQVLAGISSSKSVAHAALLDICFSKDLQN